MSNEVFKLIGIILVASVLIITIRTRLQEYAFLLGIAVVIVSVLLGFDNVLPSVTKLKQLFSQSGSNSIYFSTALKALGISYITGFASDICRDNGLSALAHSAEIVGKCAIFALSVPLVITIMETTFSLVGL